MDFTAHNEEAARVWDAYWKGAPIRVPVGNFTIGPRVWLLNPELNTERISMREFSTDPELMFRVLLEYKHYLHHHVVHDIEMGVPRDGWEVFVEFNNITEAAWLGCEVIYLDDQVPATTPKYVGKNKYDIFEKGVPDPFGGIFARVKECYESFVAQAAQAEYCGKPVRVALPWTGFTTGGPLTLAMDLCGQDILSDMLAEPDYYHRLMEFIIEATVSRTRAWSTHLGLDPRPERGGFADDAIQHISAATYQELVLPYHKRLLSELFSVGPDAMHLCGNVQRHLPTIVKELGVRHFDTGFPIDFSKLRDDIGEQVHVNGGVRIDILQRGTPEDIRAEVKRILSSGVTRGGRFIMKEANNMPPRTPEENIRAMYEATREFGVYAAH